MEQIKVGDKVRVREDAPRMYWSWMFAGDFYVEIVQDDNAAISQGPSIYPIPLKYLIKVGDEAKEAKIKLGDMVRVKENLHEPFCLDADLHLEITNMPPHAVSQKEWKVIKVEVRRDCAERVCTLNNGDSFIYNIPEDCVELVEPTEQTEAEKMQNAKASELRDLANHGVSVGDEIKRRIKERDEKPNVGPIKIPVEVDLTDGYWQAYAADLAKGIAVKVANKFNDPEVAAGYAVKVAKAVTEGLKKK